MQVLCTSSSPGSSAMPVKNQLAGQWSCQHLTASCRGKDISLAHPKKARASHQERTTTWTADSVPSASDTPTSPPESEWSGALLIRSPPTQLGNALFNASVAWMHSLAPSLLNSVSKRRNPPFPVLLGYSAVQFPSQLWPSQSSNGPTCDIRSQTCPQMSCPEKF